MNNKSGINPYLILVPVSLLLCLSFNSCEQKNNSYAEHFSTDQGILPPGKI
jgi:hypothetical protein